MAKTDPGTQIARYMHLRDVELKELQQKFAAEEFRIKNEMTGIENQFVRAFGKQLKKPHPTTTVSSSAGHCYREVKTSLRVHDAKAFRDYILMLPYKRIQLLEARVAKVETLKLLTAEGSYKPTAKDEPLESFDANPMPGITLTKIESAKFAKPTKRG